MADAEPATFWLTDFLARNFERLVIRGLGIDRHPELEATYFAHYPRVVYLSQTDDPDLLAMARAAAARLGLAFEHRHVGLGELATSIAAFASGQSAGDSRAASAGDELGAGAQGSGRNASETVTAARSATSANLHATRRQRSYGEQASAGGGRARGGRSRTTA